MTKGADNVALFDAGMKRAKSLMQNHLLGILKSAANGFMKDIETNKGYQGFTGNTQTSYTFGLYVDGVLREAIRQRSWRKPPVRLKVPKDKVVYLKRPYEGNARFVRGKVDVDDKFGQDTALEFLANYSGAASNGISIVVTTGTEYSEFLEAEKHLNVLTATWQASPSIMKHSLTQIK